LTCGAARCGTRWTACWHTARRDPATATPLAHPCCAHRTLGFPHNQPQPTPPAPSLPASATSPAAACLSETLCPGTRLCHATHAPTACARGSSTTTTAANLRVSLHHTASAPTPHPHSRRWPLAPACTRPRVAAPTYAAHRHTQPSALCC
jgi:hypothetical protein